VRITAFAMHVESMTPSRPGGLSCQGRLLPRVWALRSRSALTMDQRCGALLAGLCRVTLMVLGLLLPLRVLAAISLLRAAESPRPAETIDS
jgi:hypothetical protein